MKIRISKRAERDLLHIQEYSVKEWGADAAASYMAHLLDAFDDIMLFKYVGTAASPKFPTTRRLVVSHHVVIYRITGNTVTVLRVRHGREYPRIGGRA